MFQNEFRETISLLVNILVAIVIVTFISSMFSAKNKLGAEQSARYLSEQKLRTREEYHRIDNKVLLADEVRANFADCIKDGLVVYYGLDENNDGYLSIGETYYAWTYEDYIKSKKDYSATELASYFKENRLPAAVRHDNTYKSLAATVVSLPQEIDTNKNVRYVAKLIYDNNDPVLQEVDAQNEMKDRTISKRSEYVTGVLFVKTTVIGVNKILGIHEG